MIELEEFSSPFIEDRLYFENIKNKAISLECSRPLLSRIGCISFYECGYNGTAQFSSPFIEDRLYLKQFDKLKHIKQSSRPLLSRIGCI